MALPIRQTKTAPTKAASRRGEGLTAEEARRFLPDHLVEASDQVIAAKDALYRADDEWIDFPWSELSHLTGVGTYRGAMKVGDIWFLCGFSGNGKTLVVTSMLEHWTNDGVKTYVMPLENNPDEFRLYMACQRIGLNPGIVLSGGLRDMLPDVRAEWEKKIEAELDFTLFDHKYRDNLKVKGVPSITLRRLQLASEEAADWGARVLVVDHIDQIDVASGANATAESIRIHQAAKEWAPRYGLAYLFTSQMNNEAVRGGRDFLAQYGPALPHHVYLGAHKRMIATGMINLHRKLRPMRAHEDAKSYAAALAASRRGDAEPMEALEPGVMAMTLMKGRNNGEKEGQRCFLAVEKGKIQSIAERDRYRTYSVGGPRREL